MIVLEDAGDDEVAVHASFFPQLEDLGGEVLVTPAQAAALELLEAMTAKTATNDAGVTNALSEDRTDMLLFGIEDPHGRARRTHSPGAPTRSPSPTATSCSARR